MSKLLGWAIGVFLLLAATSAVGWVYTSHKYDCFNIGPCRGDIDFWIKWGDTAFHAFIGSWLALLASTFLRNRQVIGMRSKVAAWILAILFPVAVLVSAHWLFNLGVSVSPA